MPYVTFAEVQDGSVYGREQWAELNTRRPGTFAKWERRVRRQIDDPLRLRYAVPFGVVPPATEPDPTIVPDAVKDWAFDLLDALFLRQMRTPGAEETTDADIFSTATTTLQAIADAADQDKPAHSELPLRADQPSGSGVVKGGPFVSSFNTPHGYFDAQALARDEGGW